MIRTGLYMFGFLRVTLAACVGIPLIIASNAFAQNPPPPPPPPTGAAPAPASATGGATDHNCIQVVGEGESEPRPHTDSRAVCPGSTRCSCRASIPALARSS